MIANGHDSPTFARLTRKSFGTLIGALQNRGELLMVELEEEKGRILRLVVFASVALFLIMMTLLLFTATIIFLCPQQYRLYVAGGFAFLYLVGAIGAVFGLKATLRQIPFSESLRQLRKDREILDAFE